MIKDKHFKYASDLTEWLNKNYENIEVISIAEAGRFSEGFIIWYKW